MSLKKNVAVLIHHVKEGFNQMKSRKCELK